MQREKEKESLRKAVQRLDEELWHQLERVWRLAKEGIQEAQKSKDGHQQGTSHCRAIEENLAGLIPDDCKVTRFSAADLPRTNSCYLFTEQIDPPQLIRRVVIPPVRPLARAHWNPGTDPVPLPL